jgi:hypothetical protein
MTDAPYAPPVETDIVPKVRPRSIYIATHIAILIALVVLAWPVLGLLGGFRIDGQHPVPDGTILSMIHAAAVGYWWLIWALTLLTDIALLVFLRWRRPPPVRKAWLYYSTLLIALNSLVVYALYVLVFRYDLHS